MATIRDKISHSCPNVCLNRALRETTPPLSGGSGRRPTPIPLIRRVAMLSSQSGGNPELGSLSGRGTISRCISLCGQLFSQFLRVSLRNSQKLSSGSFRPSRLYGV